MAASAHAAPVADALERPALAVREPARSVLLGAALCGSRVVAVGERGVAAVSDDAGVSWRQARVPVSVTLTAVRCVDAHNAWAVGHGGVVLASVDGGLTWTRKLDGRRAAQIALDAARTGGDAQAQQEAQRLVADGPDKPFLDLHFFDAKRGVVVGAYGLAFATEDGGQTWQPWMQRLPNPKGAHLYALRVRGDSVLLAGEQGLVLLSTDAGRSFRKLELPYAGSFFTAELPAPQEIVVAGLRGNVWRSTDGGGAWSQLAAPAPVSVTASALAPDGRLLFANQGGEILKIAGPGLVALPLPALPPLNALQPLAGGALLALGVQGAIPLPANAGKP
nr:YCF48-related protein [Ramlibacter paludis]